MEENYVLKRIRDMMAQRGWSIYKLAKESDIPYSSLNSLFLKNNQPTIYTLEKICSGFHVSLSQFFEENLLDVPVCDFTAEETEMIAKLRNLPRHDRRLLLTLLDVMQGLQEKEREQDALQKDAG